MGRNTNAQIRAEIMARVEKLATNPTEVKIKLNDVLLDISIGRLAHQYFDKPASWLYNRIDGCNDKDEKVEFTPDEIIQLKKALLDLSKRIETVALTL